MAEIETEFPLPPIPEEAKLEIDNFEAEVGRFQRGELSPERFRAFRLAHGIYGQRQPGVQMVRVKIPAGQLNGAQLRRLADIAVDFTATGLSHLTTRQDIQFHYVQLDRVPQLLRLLAEVGLTTREACGNSVRNVTACPLTGFIADELFDVQPYALATYAFLVRNAFCQQLARKFKIAFSSCPEDCASTAIHDIGLVGRRVEENGRVRLGFKVLVGGGLGSTPFTAQTLEEFVPLANLLTTIRGIVKVFSEYGNRRNKMKARLKFVVHKQGIVTFRREVADAIAALTVEERAEADLLLFVPERFAATVAQHIAVRPGDSSPGPTVLWSIAAAAPAPSVYAAHGINKGICGAEGALQTRLDTDGTGAGTGTGMEFSRWMKTNVREHKDRARAVVTVAVPLGDLEAPRLRALARLVTTYAGDEARVAIHQNLVLPNVERARLHELYEGLVAHELAEGSVGTALDVTSCPGADTCTIGITSSKGLARAIRSELLPIAENGGRDLLHGMTIKISGCPNSCGQHHVANIGFHGVAKRVGDKQIPAYQLHLGGRITGGDATIGEALDKIPARNVPKAVTALVRLFEEGRRDAEKFADFVARCPRETLAQALKPLADDVSEADTLVDWGQETPFTTDEVGTGECAGAGTDVAVGPFDNYETEILQARLFMERGQWVDALANLNRSQYTLARVLLERLGKHPDSDYETTCEIRAQIIDRGYASERWNVIHAEIEGLLRARVPDPQAVEALHGSARDLLEESRSTLAVLDRKRASATTEIPG